MKRWLILGLFLVVLCNGCTNLEGKKAGSPTTGGQTNSEANNGSNIISDTEKTTVINYKMKTMENEYKKDDEVVLTSSYSYPVFTIDNNKELEKNLNNLIEKEKNEFIQQDVSLNQDAVVAYEESKGIEDMTFNPFTSSCYYQVYRADESVISMCLTYNLFTGGAHGNYVLEGLTIDSKTGKTLSFEDLSHSMDQFKESQLNYVLDLCKDDFYKDRMFEYNEEAVKEAIFTTNKWYFANSGMVFISDPYMLGPYAAGALLFTVPYEKMDDLNSQYGYRGNKITETPIGEKTTMDLNGDNVEEDIVFNVEYSEDYTKVIPKLTINDQDVSNIFDELNLTNLESEYYISDMDGDETTLEIGVWSFKDEILESESSIGETLVVQYGKDKTAICLGMAKGYVNTGNFQMISK